MKHEIESILRSNYGSLFQINCIGTYHGHTIEHLMYSMWIFWIKRGTINASTTNTAYTLHISHSPKKKKKSCSPHMANSYISLTEMQFEVLLPIFLHLWHALKWLSPVWLGRNKIQHRRSITEMSLGLVTLFFLHQKNHGAPIRMAEMSRRWSRIQKNRSSLLRVLLLVFSEKYFVNHVQSLYIYTPYCSIYITKRQDTTQLIFFKPDCFYTLWSTLLALPK